MGRAVRCGAVGGVGIQQCLCTEYSNYCELSEAYIAHLWRTALVLLLSKRGGQRARGMIYHIYNFSDLAFETAATRAARG
jgi:hypothetical protein